MKAEVQKLMEAVAKAHWNLDIRQFAQRIMPVAGRTTDAETFFENDIWVTEKWNAFRRLHTALCSFNPELLAAVLEDPKEK